jgi:hypothetical protein
MDKQHTVVMTGHSPTATALGWPSVAVSSLTAGRSRPNRKEQEIQKKTTGNKVNKRKGEKKKIDKRKTSNKRKRRHPNS